MKASPLVSIILPVYNVELYLGECLDSVLQQTFTDFELIAVNDGSTDTSREILEQYVSKFSGKLIVVDQKNGGLSAARNTGLNHANGTYVYFLDSDDWILPETLANCVEAFVDYDADLIVFNAKAFCDGMPEVHLQKLDYTRNLPSEFYTDGQQLFRDSRKKGTYIVQSCCYMYKRSVHEDLRFIEGILHEDHFFTTLLFLNSSKIKVLKDRFFQRRIRQNSITTSSLSMRHATGYYDTAEALYKHLSNTKHYSSEVNLYLNYLIQTGFKIERSIGTKRVGVLRKIEIIKENKKIMRKKDYPWILFPNQYKKLFKILKS